MPTLGRAGSTLYATMETHACTACLEHSRQPEKLPSCKSRVSHKSSRLRKKSRTTSGSKTRSWLGPQRKGAMPALDVQPSNRDRHGRTTMDCARCIPYCFIMSLVSTFRAVDRELPGFVAGSGVGVQGLYPFEVPQFGDSNSGQLALLCIKAECFLLGGARSS